MKLDDYPPQEPLSAARRRRTSERVLARGAGVAGREARVRQRSLPAPRPSIRADAAERRRARLLPRRRLDQRLQGMDGVHGAGLAWRAASPSSAPAIGSRRGIVFPVGFDDCGRRRSPGCTRTSATHGGDPRRIFVGGHSAGGHYAALLAATADWRDARGLPARHRARLPAGLGRVSLRRRQRPDDAAALPRPGRRGRPRRRPPRRCCASTPDACAPFLLAWGSRDFPHLIAQATADGWRRCSAPAVAAEAFVLEGADHFEASLACGQAASGWPRPRPALDARQHRAHPTPDEEASMTELSLRRRVLGCSPPSPPSPPAAPRRRPTSRCASASRWHAPACSPNATPSQMNTYELWREQVNAARRPRRRRQEAQGRVRRLRRPVEARAGGAHLREADHRRQGRPAARAVGHAVPHRDRAGAREVQVPDGRQHRGLGGAAPDQARLHLVPDLGDPGPHRRRADRDAEGAERQVGGGASPTCCRSPRRSRTSSSPS